MPPSSFATQPGHSTIFLRGVSALEADVAAGPRKQLPSPLCGLIFDLLLAAWSHPVCSASSSLMSQPCIRGFQIFAE